MLLRALETLARRRRRTGSHPVWAAVSFAALLLRMYKKREGRDAPVVREELKPGETLLITHLDHPQG